jgi:hypothetical protein
MDLAAISPIKWVAQGATIDLNLTVRVLNMGVAQANIPINFRVAKGTANLSSGTGNTNNNGYATTSVHLANHTSDVQVTACVAPTNAPCQTFTMFATPASNLRIENISGANQVVTAGQPFQPLVVRITDGASPSNPVMGANLVFDVIIERIPQGGGSGGGGGDDDGGGGHRGTPVILGTYEEQGATADGGLASWLPTVKDVQGYCDLLITLDAGPVESQFHLQVVQPIQ